MKITEDGKHAIAQVFFPSSHPDVASRWHVNQISVIAAARNTHGIAAIKWIVPRQIAWKTTIKNSIVPYDEILQLRIDLETEKMGKKFYKAVLADAQDKILVTLSIVASPNYKKNTKNHPQ